MLHGVPLAFDNGCGFVTIFGHYRLEANALQAKGSVFLLHREKAALGVTFASNRFDANSREIVSAGRVSGFLFRLMPFWHVSKQWNAAKAR